MASSELDSSRSVDVEYSIVSDSSSQDRSASVYFSVDSLAGLISTKASLSQFGT